MAQKPDQEYVGVYISRRHFKQLKKRAKAEERSLSWLLRTIIAESVERDNAKKAA